MTGTQILDHERAYRGTTGSIPAGKIERLSGGSPGSCGGMARMVQDTPIIDCRNIWKVYGGDQQRPEIAAAIARGGIGSQADANRFGCVLAVADVSFTVGRGETFCIMGLSGSGKSTLLRHLNRLIEPTAGTVLIDGIDIGRMRAEELRGLRASKISMVFQDMALWPHMTVRRNIAYGLEVQRKTQTQQDRAVDGLLELVQLSGWGERYPDELSGGMKQRVGLARALATDPDILLLDEPFSALDPLIRQQLQAQFLQIAGIVNKTIVFITHDLHEATRLGGRIAIMKDGRFTQIGTPEEIVMHPHDDYVRDFIRGIPRFNLIRARSIMQKLEPGATNVEVAGLPRISEDAKLDATISLLADCQGSIAVIDANGIPIGLITSLTVVRAIRETL